MSEPERSLASIEAVARRIVEAKFRSAEVAFCAGSIVRGEGTATSDLDLVLVFGKVDQAWRESFVFERWPVEAFVHDPATLDYFFREVDAKSGIPSLPQMVLEGLVVWGTTAEANKYSAAAKQIMESGPQPLAPEEIRDRIYGIGDLANDLAAPKSREEAIAIGAQLYGALGDFALRSKGLWSGEGKQLVRALERQAPQLKSEFTAAFERLLSKGDSRGVLELAEKLIVPFGGSNFDGFRRDAPAHWRSG
jgi:predicted nucleotidyltransferase